MKEKRFWKKESAKMGWIEENNYIYILISVENFAKNLNWTGECTIAAIEELKSIGLLEMEEAMGLTWSSGPWL